MRIIKLSIVLILITLILSDCEMVSYSNGKSGNTRTAKNIILFIGDGTGFVHWNTAYYLTGKNLAIQKFTHMGIQIISSADTLVTDSGAAGTAIATGHKTRNGYIGLDENKNIVNSILEIAESKGLSTGLVATSTITHATPAAFIAHNPSRSDQEGIALDFLKTDIDLFIGGGSRYFSKRSDNLNLIDSLTQKGYTVTYSLTDAALINEGKFAVFTDTSHNPPAHKGRGEMLREATELAIKHLSKNKNGFFLMVEGSQIDWASHSNDKEYLLAELLDFNKAVEAGYAFAKQNTETLVIVTGDHETGGLTFLGGDVDNGKIELIFNSTHHTPMWVPVFTYGPGAEKFGGIYENSMIFNKMAEAFGFNSY